MPDIGDLRQKQALPLTAKVHMSQARIREWYDYWQGNVYISFSGGKDSTVLAHMVHEYYPHVPLVFSNTGLEYPEIQAFARKMGAEFVRPKMSFSEVISKYGYPIISKETAEAIAGARRLKPDKLRGGVAMGSSETDGTDGPAERKNSWYNWRRKCLTGVGEFSKENKSIYNKEKWLPLCQETQFQISNQCCRVIKKHPLEVYNKQHHAYPYLGTQTEESRLREQKWLQNGCNAYDGNKKTSQPMSFWLEQDVLQYIYDKGLEICSVYGEIVAQDESGMEYMPIPGLKQKLKCSGCNRTGCIFCGFGCYLDKGETRFQRLAKTHPRQYEYCMGGGQWVDNPKYDPAAPEYDGDWKNWNPKKIWVPSKEGLGMKKVFDDCNALYGKDFIRYE